MQQRIQQLRETFEHVFGDDTNTTLTRAPGRVNTIGEHTDYNDGYVLPIAIDRDALVLFRPNSTQTVNIHSLNYNETASFALGDTSLPPGQKWLQYPFGIAKILQEDGHPICGIDAVTEGNVPLGGGLSSSASFEVAFALAYCAAAGLDLDRLTLARICQRAENKYAGVNCGIMDPYVSLFAQKDHAVFLDCRNLTHQLVPFRTDAVKLVVSDTGVRHSLAGSEYNKRRAKCEEGAAFFASELSHVKNLRDVTVDDITQFAAYLEPEVLKRCRHVVTENARTLAAVRALREKNVFQFGILMSASHESLRDDYEVTCKELDIMADIANELTGVFGARMTGGGFGGCVISLVAVEDTDNFCQALAKEYQAATGLHSSINVIAPENGAEIL